jgi:iron complex outermembrane receptor protein
MRSVERFCAQHPNFGIPNLMRYIAIGSGIFWIVGLINPVLLSYMAFSPAAILGGGFSLHARGARLDWHTGYVSKQYLDNTHNNTAALRAYSTTNIHLRYLMPIRNWVKQKKEREAKGYVPDITLLCQINNVFNAKYASNGGSDCSYFTDGRACWAWYYAQAGINVHAGFIVQF